MEPTSPTLRPQHHLTENKTVVSMSNNPNHNISNQNDKIDITNNNKGSIAERRAAKFGFNAERINTARFRTTSPLVSPSASVRSPLITIPPGISPTALLDSPVMVPNSKPSPTTGTFVLPLSNYESSMLNMVIPADGDRSSDAGSSFRFNPYGTPDCLPGFSTLENQGRNADCQAVVLVEQSVDFEFPAEFSKETTAKSCAGDSVTDVKVLDSMVVNADFCRVQISGSDVPSNQTSQQTEPVHGENVGTYHPMEEQNGIFPTAGTGRTSEDGYNWRKYGQKQVKGSEYPRSYYKCTHPNCQVKKKIERSHDGQITEIIYKGTHNHPQPQPSRRLQLGSTSSIDEMPDMDEGSGTSVKVEGGSVWKNIQSGTTDFKLGCDWRGDGLERTSSTSVVTELSDPMSITQGKCMGPFESAETPELSSTLASHDEDDDDGVLARMISAEGDADDEESETKRRKIESCLVETNMASRAVREPRVVVQIESEVDILDDGYRWRKYGQKVVKGNPNPRSYYKCTSPGCSVRKHVERASHNLKYVITTYEGKHNHEVPAARNTSQVNSSSSNVPQPTTNAQPSLVPTQNSNGPKPETQIEDFVRGFGRKPVFKNDHLRRGLPANFGNEMKLGPASIYPMKFPSIQTSMPYSAFGLNSNCSITHHSGSIASLIPDFPISLPLSLHASGNLCLSGVDFNNNGKPGGQVQPFLLGQQLIRPKQEQRDDNLYNAGPCMVDHINSSSSVSSSGYHQMMRNFHS